jgi:hypothetical protein
MLMPQRRSGTGTAGIAIAATLAALVCCAALPAIGALIGGLTLAAVLGLGLGGVAVVALAWAGTVVVTRRLRRARCGSAAGKR